MDVVVSLGLAFLHPAHHLLELGRVDVWLLLLLLLLLNRLLLSRRLKPALLVATLLLLLMMLLVLLLLLLLGSEETLKLFLVGALGRSLALHHEV